MIKKFLHEITVNCSGEKHISGAGTPLIAVAKIIFLKTFLGTSYVIFYIQWDIFNNCHKL